MACRRKGVKIVNRMNFREANKIFEYNPKTGKFIWKTNIGNNIKAGQQVTGTRSTNKNRTNYVDSKRKRYSLSCIAWLLMRREWQDKIYHIDSNKSNLIYNNLTLEKPTLTLRDMANKTASLILRAESIGKTRLTPEVKSNISGNSPTAASPVLSTIFKSAVSVTKPTAELKFINKTKPLVSGRKKLTSWDDEPEKIKCFCAVCLKTFYRTFINFQGTIPCGKYCCKKCKPKKDPVYNFTRKVEETLEKIQKTDMGES